MRRLTWNVWAEDGEQPFSFRPASTLQPERSYHLAIELAGLVYRIAGVGSIQACDAFRQYLTQTKVNELSLQLRIMPDPNYFGPTSGGWHELKIDLKKLRADLERGKRLSADPMTLLRRANGEAAFSYGRYLMLNELRPTGKTGRAPISVSVWAGTRALEEFTTWLCVSKDGSPCTESGSESASTTLDWIYLASDLGHQPAAGLHFYARQGDIIAEFRRADRLQRFATWRLGTEKELRHLLTSRLAEFSSATTDVTMRELGHHISDILFRDLDTNNGAMNKDLEEFLSTAPTVRTGAARPTLFVRMVQNTADAPMLIPLGLAALPGSPQTLVGERFEIELPLEHTFSTPPTSCIKRWVTALPPEPPPGVTDPLSDLLQLLKHSNNRPRTLGPCETASESAKCYRSLGEFSLWLNRSVETPEPASVLSILAHNGLDRMWQYEKDEILVAQDFRRRFAEPSLAMLVGCSTGTPKGARLLRRVNSLGFSTVIATNADIAGHLAANFIDCFAEELAKDESATVDQVFRRTTNECLAKRRKDPLRNVAYGDQALKFFLAGNGNFHVCPPDADRHQTNLKRNP